MDAVVAQGHSLRAAKHVGTLPRKAVERRLELHGGSPDLPAIISARRMAERVEAAQTVEEIHAAVQEELAATGARLHGSHGEVVPFEPRTMRVLGEGRPQRGQKVMVYRAGVLSDRENEGRPVLIEPAQVEVLSPAEVRAHEAAQAADALRELDLPTQASAVADRLGERGAAYAQRVNAHSVRRGDRLGPEGEYEVLGNPSLSGGMAHFEVQHRATGERHSVVVGQNTPVNRVNGGNTGGGLSKAVVLEDELQPDAWDHALDDLVVEHLFKSIVAELDLDETELDELFKVATSAEGVTGAERLHRWWTKGKGLAKWLKSPHPWTALYHHLLKHMKGNVELAKRTASQWFHDATGMWPGERKGKNPVGRG